MVELYTSFDINIYILVYTLEFWVLVITFHGLETGLESDPQTTLSALRKNSTINERVT